MNAEQTFGANFRRELAARNIAADPALILRLLEQHNPQITLPEGAVGGWLYGHLLPRWTTLELLAQWLGCGKTALLPESEWAGLKGYQTDAADGDGNSPRQ